MSKHVWEVKKMSEAVRRRGLHAYGEAALAGITPKVIPAFVGYYLESVRQSGWVTVEALLKSAVAYCHRYAKGKNAVHYANVGRRIAESFGVPKGTSPENAAATVVLILAALDP